MLRPGGASVPSCSVSRGNGSQIRRADRTMHQLKARFHVALCYVVRYRGVARHDINHYTETECRVVVVSDDLRAMPS